MCSKLNQTKISLDAPQWFKFANEKSTQALNELLIKNEDTISIFSKHQQWITLTPRSKNRRKPLEKVKVIKMDETSKIMPKWMQNKHVTQPCPDTFRSAEYNSLKNVRDNYFILFIGKEICCTG